MNILKKAQDLTEIMKTHTPNEFETTELANLFEKVENVYCTMSACISKDDNFKNTYENFKNAYKNFR